MNLDQIKDKLNSFYGNVEQLGPEILCSVSKYKDVPYAINYFDLSNNIAKRAENLDEYLSDILGDSYFDPKKPIDLRWNNYLYFLISEQDSSDITFIKAKETIESNREYARKFVVNSNDIDGYIRAAAETDTSQEAVKDLYSIWLDHLNQKNYGYILKLGERETKILRDIESGKKDRLTTGGKVGDIDAADQAAVNCKLKNISKVGFRAYPKENSFSFGSKVNLIVAPNGYGKTSLLEMIEYLYCGSTFRNGDIPSGSELSADLLGTEEVLRINSNVNNTKKLKARNLAWYGKTDLRGASVQDSFARFNFLDTDAAVRLSTSTSPDKLSDDITYLILGAEAGKASDQVSRVYKKVNDSIEEKTRIVSVSQLNLNMLSEQLKTLSSMTSESDIKFENLVQLIAKLGWRDAPPQKSKESIESLVSRLNDVKNQCLLLDGVNKSLISQKKHRLDEEKDRFLKVSKSLSATLRKIKTISSDLDIANSKLVYLDEFKSYVGTNLNIEKLARDNQKNIVSQLKNDIPQEVDFGKVPKLYHTMSLSDAIQRIINDLDTCSNKISENKIRIEEHEKSQSELHNQREILISSAEKIMKQNSSHDQCPLCDTEFEPGVLLEKLRRTKQASSSERSIALRNEIKDLEDKRSELLNIKSHLDKAGGHYSSELISEIIIDIDRKKHKLVHATNDFNRHENRINELANNGLTVPRLAELQKNLEFKDLTEEEYFRLKTSIESLKESLNDNIDKEKLEKKVLESDLEFIADYVGYNEGFNVSRIEEWLDEERLKLDKQDDALRDIAESINIDDSTLTGAVAIQISEVVDNAIKCITTITQNVESQTRISSIKKDLQRNQSNLESNKKILIRLKAAKEAIDGLLTGRNSKENIKKNILNNNSVQISEIFSKIHLPREYVLKIDGNGIQLINKFTGDSRSLSEVSTGQRAAFALSLFLAINKNLINAPKLMLLDDPVSHIDDVNVLSFMDYLREISLKSQRQIFFATPNEKLASLFKHKFNFLDDSEFKVIKLER